MTALSGQNRPQRSFGYACGDFAPAALALNFSLGLITTRLLDRLLANGQTDLTFSAFGTHLLVKRPKAENTQEINQYEINLKGPDT